jgi:hypothetical protein
MPSSQSERMLRSAAAPSSSRSPPRVSPRARRSSACTGRSGSGRGSRSSQQRAQLALRKTREPSSAGPRAPDTQRDQVVRCDVVGSRRWAEPPCEPRRDAGDGGRRDERLEAHLFRRVTAPGASSVHRRGRRRRARPRSRSAPSRRRNPADHHDVRVGAEVKQRGRKVSYARAGSAPGHALQAV